MKIKKMLSVIFAIAMLVSIFTMPAHATNVAELETHEHIEIIIENEEISEETKEKIIAFYSNSDDECEGATTYGLTCTLFGHKLESSLVTTVTHKVRTTSPRCLKKTYNYEACTRCDFEEDTLLSSTYIVCC